MQFPFITYGMALYRQYNDKIITLRKIYEYASELRKFLHFHILQLPFPFLGGVQGARLRAPGGVQGQSPCRGSRGRSPRKILDLRFSEALKLLYLKVILVTF